MPPIAMPATAEPMHAPMLTPVPWSAHVLANDEASDGGGVGLGPREPGGGGADGAAGGEGSAEGREGGAGGEGGDMCRAPQSAQSVPRAQSGWDP